MSGIFLETLGGKAATVPPVWLMRQAGRYLKEYRAVRETAPDFIAFCLDAQKAVEVTLQPIERFGFDAAIIFSDILLVPWALDREVDFVEGRGPVLRPLNDGEVIEEPDPEDFGERLRSVGEAIALCRRKLADDKALIGFAGAPWTVMTYMLEGGSSRDFATSRQRIWSDEKGFGRLMEVVTQCTLEFLSLQARSGADALMVFDSWAGAMPAHFRHETVIRPMQEIIAGLRGRGHSQPVIGFPKGIGEGLLEYCAKTGVDGVGLDHGVDMAWAARNLPRDVALQGNLDPASLVAGGAAMLRAADGILDACQGRPHIFNLGHGIAPNTPVENVRQLVGHLRGSSG